MPPDSRHPEVVKLTGTKGGAFMYEGDAAYAVSDRGFFLRLEGLRLARGTLHIPVSAIISCSRTVLPSRTYSNLWVREAKVEVALADRESHLIKWCQEQGIPVVDAGLRMRDPT